MKTAVDYLVSQLHAFGIHTAFLDDSITQAKEKERQQIEDAFAEGHARFTECGEFELEDKAEDYYNQTYKP